jgi:uncharacterized membrane protein
MIPLLAVLKFRNRRNRGFGLWIPLILIWLLLLPVILLLLPVVLVLCLVGRVSAVRALSTSWQIFTGFRGVQIEVGTGNGLVSIRIF